MIDPDALASGQFNASAPSFALAKQVLDEAIAHHNGTVAFDIDTPGRSGVFVQSAGIGEGTLTYHGTRRRSTPGDPDGLKAGLREPLHFYGLEDPAGVQIGLMVIDEDEVTEVGVTAYDSWCFWGVGITVAGGTTFNIGTVFS